MRLLSAAETGRSPARRRVRREDFASSLCRPCVCSRISLPEPVVLTRFLVPLWVLFFGMEPCLLVVRRLAGASSGRCLVPDLLWDGLAGSSVLLVGVVRSGAAGLLLGGVRLRCEGRLLAAVVPLGRPGRGGVAGALRPGLGLILVRPQDNDHVAPVLLRGRLDETELLVVGHRVLRQRFAELDPQVVLVAKHLL